MANLEQFKLMDVQERQTRYFSDELKRKLVGEIDRKLCTVAEVCREYQVRRSSVYKWIYKYSVMRKKKVKIVIEAESETRKMQEMRAKIRDLEQMVGQKQIEIDFLKKMIELTEEDLGIDIKKKGRTWRFNGSGKTGTGFPIR